MQCSAGQVSLINLPQEPARSLADVGSGRLARDGVPGEYRRPLAALYTRHHGATLQQLAGSREQGKDYRLFCVVSCSVLCVDCSVVCAL